jgi:hypothetical protein
MIDQEPLGCHNTAGTKASVLGHTAHSQAHSGRFRGNWRDGSLARRLPVVSPPSRRLLRRGRIIGTIAILLGLIKFALIMYAVTTQP